MKGINGTNRSEGDYVDGSNTPSDPVPASDYESESSTSPLQKISDHEKDLDLREIALKEELFGKVVPYFVRANASVLVGIVILLIVETMLVWNNSEYVRVTNDKVLICLLTATTVQLGTIALRIGKSLFK